MKDFSEVWNKIIDVVKEEMPSISLDTWIKPLKIIDITDDKIILQATTEYQKSIIETRYFDLLKNGIKYATLKDYELSVILDMENKDENENISNMYGYSNTSLNPKYTFDTFVIGDNSRFAHAACVASAETSASQYNPLFIYGGVGLGKTHLLHAIGNFRIHLNPDAKVLYVTSERFLNDLVNALMANKNEEFRLKYRNIDLLLIDDIQFIAKKEKLQEEFFNTFNALYEQGKQIVLASDRPPKDIHPLEDRLKTRFEWGLIADIGMPDYETRLAILKKKVMLDKLIIDDNILEYIASKVDTNIRELEGTLNKIVAEASLINKPITLENALKAISHMSSSNNKTITASKIKEAVANYFEIPILELSNKSRVSTTTLPRQIAMYLCRELIQMSFPKISNEFGKKDHTTSMHAHEKIQKAIKDNHLEIKETVDNLKELLITK